MESGQPLMVMPRACPNCKLRKIRCDRSIPCSSCVSSGLTCRPSAKSAAEPIPVATFNEQQFERLHRRLDSVEQAIRNLTEHAVVSQNVPRPQRRQQQAQTLDFPSQSYIPDDDDTYRFPEGDSSFGRQTVVATQIAELSIAHCGPSSAIAQEMDNLKRLLRENRSFQRAGHLHSSGAKHSRQPEHELLPTDCVLHLLSTVDDTKSYLFTFYGLHDCAQIKEICTTVYFPIQPATEADITLCHGMLCTLLRDPHTAAHRELNIEEITKHRRACEGIFQAGVESYEVVAVPTFENTLILSLAMSYAQNEGKLPLQWTLISVAARHCLALGYHREDRLAQLPRLKAERARRLFWHIYISDNILSSRLGRTSVIQDCDLDTKLYSISNEPGRAPWDQAAVLFIELSRIQGQIYQALYSASTENLDPQKRNHIVSALDERLVRWHTEWVQIDPSRAHQRECFRHTFGPVEIVYCSILTLLHRGRTTCKSMLNISPACLQAAYQCLNAHLAYSSTLQVPPGYAIWLFNFTSFTAFTIIFTNCVVNTSSSDLEILRKVLLSLEQVAVQFDYSEWQFNLCNALYRIADAFIQLRREEYGGIIGAGPQNPFLDGWSWLDTSLSSMLEMGGQIDGMDSL